MKDDFHLIPFLIPWICKLEILIKPHFITLFSIAILSIGSMHIMPSLPHTMPLVYVYVRKYLITYMPLMKLLLENYIPNLMRAGF